MEYAESFTKPYWLEISKAIERKNGKDHFYLRECQLFFNVFWGETWRCNVKVLVYHHFHDSIQTILVDTDPYDVESLSHKRRTRNFFIHPKPMNHGDILDLRFSFVVHFEERSITSQYIYPFCDGNLLKNPAYEMKQAAEMNHLVTNHYKTCELNPNQLQEDANLTNWDVKSLGLKPVFTKGDVRCVYHPKHWIHQQIDWVIGRKVNDGGRHSIKVSVDDVDDEDFTKHLVHAQDKGVVVQCIVDWRKMILTNSQGYARLKRSGIELIGVACMPTDDPLIEVDPDMHTKFIIFDMEVAIMGSFNITFDVWPSNWEAGMIMSSPATCRLLDNVFQSIRGGVVQKYSIDPLAPFNILYTYGRHRITTTTKNYRPHQSILYEIDRAQSSIKVVLFLIGTMIYENDNVVDALIRAKNRGVDVKVILNGHVVRVGPNDKPFIMNEELARPVVPAVMKLQTLGVTVYLAYGMFDQPVPYCPIHSKYVVIDEFVVIDGSFNWYNTSIFSHDLVVVVKDKEVCRPYLEEFHQICKNFRLYNETERVQFNS